LTPTPTSTPAGFTVTIGVYNSAGELIKTLLIHSESIAVKVFSLSPTDTIGSLQQSVTVYVQGQPLAVWDSNGQDGNPVSNGQYYIQIASVDPYGSVTTVTQPVIVNRSYAQVSVDVYNEAGEVVRHLMSQYVPSIESVVHNLTLSTSVIVPGGSPGETQIQVDTGLSIPAWDGDNDAGVAVQSGQYYVAVHTIDGKGGEATLTQAVVVMNSTQPVKLVLATPNVLRGPEPMFIFTVQNGITHATLKVHVYDLAGEMVTAFTAVEQNGQVTWLGHRLASGMYLAVIEVSDSDGDVLGRQTLHIIVLN
jgi:flagellar hook assembly protein FlgD